MMKPKIIAIGRATADLEMKNSQNGKNTKYVQFGLAVNIGYGEEQHPNFYNCVAFGALAQRMIDAKVKKGSLIQVTADQEIVDFTRKDGTPGTMPKLTLLDWDYVPTNRPKDDTNGSTPASASAPAEMEDGFAPVEDCGDNGLPFD